MKNVEGRLKELFFYENRCREKGFTLIAGIDEAGRGPLAGPVAACALILPDGAAIEGVNDSKQLSAAKRETLETLIRASAVAVSVGFASHEEIDRFNILNATRLAMKRAVENLAPAPDFLLIDGKDTIDVPLPQQAIIRGDCLSHTVAAASIVAKVARDKIMRACHKRYPQYGFDKHKGYGTKAHREALKIHGLCPIHRQSFTKRIVT